MEAIKRFSSSDSDEEEYNVNIDVFDNQAGHDSEKENDCEDSEECSDSDQEDYDNWVKKVDKEDPKVVLEDIDGEEADTFNFECNFQLPTAVVQAVKENAQTVKKNRFSFFEGRTRQYKERVAKHTNTTPTTEGDNTDSNMESEDIEFEVEDEDKNEEVFMNVERDVSDEKNEVSSVLIGAVKEISLGSSSEDKENEERDKIDMKEISLGSSGEEEGDEETDKKEIVAVKKDILAKNMKKTTVVMSTLNKENTVVHKYKTLPVAGPSTIIKAPLKAVNTVTNRPMKVNQGHNTLPPRVLPSGQTHKVIRTLPTVPHSPMLLTKKRAADRHAAAAISGQDTVSLTTGQPTKTTKIIPWR